MKQLYSKNIHSAILTEYTNVTKRQTATTCTTLYSIVQ